MTTQAVVMMGVVLCLTWGAFVVLMVLAFRKERSKRRSPSSGSSEKDT